MPMPEPRPISVSDDQLIFVTGLVEPLHPTDRSAFLRELAAALQQQAEPIGDGILHRKASELFKRFFRPPVLSAAQTRYQRPSSLRDRPAIE
jgi:hypothetical protein